MKMSKRVSRFSSVILVVFICLFMLAGCGGQKAEPSTSSTAATTAAPTETQQPAEPVTVDWLAYNTYAQPDPESEIIQRASKDYNINFKFWFVDDQKWDEVLGVKLASGEMPDVMKIKDSGTIPKYVSMGVVAPITDDMLKKIPAVTNAIEQMGGKDMTIDGYVNGKLYLLKTANLSASYPTVLVWRTDWLKNVGISKMPETIPEMEDALTRFRNNDPDKNGVKDTFGMSNTVISAIFGAYGAIPLKEFRGSGTQNLFWTKKDGKYVFAVIQPEMKEALALLAKWYKDGLIDPEFVTGENTGGYWAQSQAFENSKIGVTGMVQAAHYSPPLFEGHAGGGCYQTYIKANPDAKFGETFDIGKPPTGPAGKSGTHCWGGIGIGGAAFTTKFVKDQRKVDAVLNMINDITSNYDKYRYYRSGEEGKHYTVDPKSGAIIAAKEYTQIADLTKAGLGVLNVMFSIPDFDKKAGSTLGTQFAEKYKYTYYTDVLVPATDAATKYSADLKKLALDAYVQIISGAKPVDYFDEFVNTFNEKGGAEIVKQVNEAVAAQ